MAEQLKDLIEKMVIFRNFSVTVNKYKNTSRLEPVKKKPIKKDKKVKNGNR